MTGIGAARRPGRDRSPAKRAAGGYLASSRKSNTIVIA